LVLDFGVDKFYLVNIFLRFGGKIYLVNFGVVGMGKGKKIRSHPPHVIRGFLFLTHPYPNTSCSSSRELFDFRRK